MKEFSIIEQQIQIKKVVDAFFELSKRNYFELYGMGKLELFTGDPELKIVVSKPTEGPFPLFLNVSVVRGNDIMEMELNSSIIIDLCNRFGLMDQKLELKFDALINEKPINC